MHRARKHYGPEIYAVGCQRCGAAPGKCCRAPNAPGVRHPHQERVRLAEAEAAPDAPTTEGDKMSTCVVCGKPFTPRPDQRRPICSEKCKAELTHV